MSGRTQTHIENTCNCRTFSVKQNQNTGETKQNKQSTQQTFKNIEHNDNINQRSYQHNKLNYYVCVS